MKLNEVKLCEDCKSPLRVVDVKITGSLLQVNTLCFEQHCAAWTSQPLVNNRTAGNLLCAEISFSDASPRKFCTCSTTSGAKFLLPAPSTSAKGYSSSPCFNRYVTEAASLYTQHFAILKIIKIPQRMFLLATSKVFENKNPAIITCISV